MPYGLPRRREIVPSDPFLATLTLHVHPESFGIPWPEYIAWLRERDWAGDLRRRDWEVSAATQLNERRLTRNARGRESDDAKAKQLRKANTGDGLTATDRRANEIAAFLAGYRLRAGSADPDSELRAEVQSLLRAEGIPENAVALRTSGARLLIDARRLGLI